MKKSTEKQKGKLARMGSPAVVLLGMLCLLGAAIYGSRSEGSGQAYDVYWLQRHWGILDAEKEEMSCISDAEKEGMSRISDAEKEQWNHFSDAGKEQLRYLSETVKEQWCHLVLEDGDGFTADQPAQTVLRGSDAEFTLTLAEGYQWEQVSDGLHDYTVRYDDSGKKLFVTLKNVQYSEALTVPVKKGGAAVTYFANGGKRLDGGDAEKGIQIAYVQSHLRLNTARGAVLGVEDGKKKAEAEAAAQKAAGGKNRSAEDDAWAGLFVREGYTQTGWNTMPDGSGKQVGLGSRIDYKEGLRLYAQWEPWTEESRFQYQAEGGFAVVTGYSGSAETICVPERLGGYPVRRICANAFEGVSCRTMILPPSMHEVEKWAFLDASIHELIFFDGLMKVSDYAFKGCKQLQRVQIHALQPPVYSGSYFDTFQDKYDRLLALKHKKKIVLFSGSSARFGYDCEKIDKTFPAYEVVNMGVFAYSPALPQLLLVLDCMQEGDIFIDAPEFDAAKRQFCGQKELDYAVFAMMESNYDAFAALDIRQFSQVFTAFSAYNALRQDMVKKSYAVLAAHYDEDGRPVDSPSYNVYGDYIVYRPNAENEQPVYGLAVPYTVRAFPKKQYIDPLNQMFGRFLQKGVQVYFTYAPRNRDAMSEDSTLTERQRLHEYFQKYLIVPVISELEDSLYSGIYMYGTDNHLSTEGVAIRTEQLIKELREYITDVQY